MAILRPGMYYPTISSNVDKLLQEEKKKTRSSQDNQRGRGSRRDDDDPRTKISGLQNLLDEIHGNLFEFNQFLRDQPYSEDKFIDLDCRKDMSKKEKIKTRLKQMQGELKELISRFNPGPST